jgi:anhydro-N-acetylmuramic acid kinase
MSVLAVGLMSGTSLDGIDAALVRIGGPADLDLVAFRTEPFDADMRAEILRVIHEGGARDLARLHVDLGGRFAAAVLRLLEAAGVGSDEIAFVAGHGQTIWHDPGRVSLQIGDPAVIAEAVGVMVVSDFRSRDVAAGGQGAPLVPIADVNLFGHPERGRALLNIGGMANVTWVPRRGVTDGVIAFDTGPGVAVVDAIVRRIAPELRFDTDGALAARGQADESVVSDWLEHPYFGAPPPKSTGRETFSESCAADILERTGGADAVATAVLLTAQAIGGALTRFLPETPSRDLVVSGGGARNPAILEALRRAIPGWPVRLFTDEFFDGDAKEAAAFAHLGWLTLEGRPGNVPSATGAAGSRVLGSITPGGT